MPKSKRDKKISLTKVDKKNGLERKQNLVDTIRTGVDSYARIFVFKVENMRNIKLKSVRDTWSHSKFFLGKNKVMAKALGKSPEDEYNSQLHKVSLCLRNQCGLLFTNEKKEDVVEYFSNMAQPDFARTGGVAQETVVLQEGPLPTEFCHSMEPMLRTLGLPTTLTKGVVTLVKEHVVCTEGETLSSEQARLLKLLGHQQAEFRLKLVAMWVNTGTFEMLGEQGGSSDGQEDMSD